VKHRSNANSTSGRRRGAGVSKSNAPPITPIWAFVLPFFFLVLGGLGIWYSGRPLYFGFASKSWPTVQGRVVQSVDGERNRSGSRTSVATVTYEYEVEGRTLMGSCVNFCSEAVPQHVTKRYPDGGGATVYYDADAPERSVLIPGSHGEFELVLYLWGSLFMAMIMLELSIRYARLLIMERSATGRKALIREPDGLIVRDDMCDADDTCLRLEIPKTKPLYAFYTRIFVVIMFVVFTAWFISEGRISFLSTVIASGAVWVVFVFMYVKGAPRMVVLIEREEATLEVTLFETIGRGWSWGGVCMPIRKIENILSNESDLSIKYYNRHTKPKRMVRYAWTSAGLPVGTIPWLAALLLLLKSRTLTKSKKNLPVWKIYGFQRPSDLLAAVGKDI
jgi:hypothetical protein